MFDVTAFSYLKDAAGGLRRLVSEMLLEECQYVVCDGPTAFFLIEGRHLPSSENCPRFYKRLVSVYTVYKVHKKPC